MAPSWNDADQVRITTPVDDDIVTEVIRTVAVCSNRPPESLPPLANAVDIDALENIFGPRPDGAPRRGGRIEFSYAGYRVVVTGHQEVSVEPFADWR